MNRQPKPGLTQIQCSLKVQRNILLVLRRKCMFLWASSVGVRRHQTNLQEEQKSANSARSETEPLPPWQSRTWTDCSLQSPEWHSDWKQDKLMCIVSSFPKCLANWSLMEFNGAKRVYFWKIKSSSSCVETKGCKSHHKNRKPEDIPR